MTQFKTSKKIQKRLLFLFKTKKDILYDAFSQRLERLKNEVKLYQEKTKKYLCSNLIYCF